MSQNLEHGPFFTKPEIRLEDPALLIKSLTVRRYGLGVITIRLHRRDYTIIIAVKQKYIRSHNDGHDMPRSLFFKVSFFVP